ncbi:hypothetical protein AXF42_Ash014368 [Apostasia shenzhenica]|uniref:Uncharacterized protein n=1 Tax=Apostasia shenzhenica TaxID=1088818 RepID=A0A2I0B0X4_9ASPA|nr:hypothetical protein AXF42_Ash014368 [Apostasia shenzhenica]
MANDFSIKQNDFAGGDGTVICPKPRRAFAEAAIHSFRGTSAQPTEHPDLKSANQLLNVLTTMGSDEPIHQSDLPLPFFCGSPPTRSGNPVVHDARFGEAVLPCPVAGLVPAPGSGRSGYARYGLPPATIRIEGFDCLDRDRRRSRDISAVA